MTVPSRQATRNIQVRWLKENTEYGNNTALQLMTDREVEQAFEKAQRERND